MKRAVQLFPDVQENVPIESVRLRRDSLARKIRARVTLGEEGGERLFWIAGLVGGCIRLSEKNGGERFEGGHCGDIYSEA